MLDIFPLQRKSMNHECVSLISTLITKILQNSFRNKKRVYPAIKNIFMLR